MSTPSPPRFWFHAEPVLTALRRFEVKSALGESAGTPEGALVGGVPPPAFPKSEVTEVTGFGQPLTWSKHPDENIGNSEVSLDIVKLRGELREGLRRLERRLGQDIREPHVRNIMHPLIIHADERMMTVTRGKASAWTPMQVELLGFDDGGVQFFTKLEELLAQPDTPDLVLEAFYYCLRDGFHGLYADNLVRIEDYKERLENRLERPVTSVDRDESEDSEVELVEFPYRFYILAGGTVVLLTLILFFVGWLHGG